MRQAFRRMWILVWITGIALVGCGNQGGNSQLVGPDDSGFAVSQRFAKAAVTPVAAQRADVLVQVTDSDGSPAAELGVTFYRSISGRAPGDGWTGTTDASGQATIAIEVSSVQYRRTGASGYYRAQAVDVAGQVVGTWHSIPIKGGEENILSLPVGGKAQVHPRGPRVTVMTRNIYLGGDINRILAPEDPEVPIPLLVAQTWGVIQQTNFPERAKAIADEIARTRPHLIGLQEVPLFRIQNPGDFLTGNPDPATDVALDFLTLLLGELDARGLTYRAAAVSEGIDIELPMATGQTTPLADIRLTNRDVILARGGVHTDNVVEKQFDAKLPINLGGIPSTIVRAWASVEATVAGRTFRFISAHLETGVAEPIQRLQAGELLAVAGAEPLPVIMLGDFNSDALGQSTQTYGDLVGAGLVDTWGIANPGMPGLTGSQKEDLLNAPSALTKRVDLIFLRSTDDFTPLKAEVVGEEEADRTPSGLWPSDHAGVVATLRLPAVKPF